MSKGLFAIIALFIVLPGWRTLAAEPDATKDVVVFADTSRTGKPFAKDPSVIAYRGRYLMYYSLPGMPGPGSLPAWPRRSSCAWPGTLQVLSDMPSEMMSPAALAAWAATDARSSPASA